MQTQIHAGETLNYRVSISDYPADDGWTLRLVLGLRTGGAVLNVDSTADGTAHLVQASADTTATWAPGEYGWELWAIKAGERYKIETGQITVQASLFGLSVGIDTRSAAQRGYDAVTLMLQGKGGSGVETYQINGRMLRSYPLPDLIKLQQKLRADLTAERVANGLPPLPGTGVQRILLRTR